MPPTDSSPHRRRRRLTAAIAGSLAVVAAVGAGAATPVAASSRSPLPGGPTYVVPGAPRTPGAPMVLDGRRLRPATAAELVRLRGRAQSGYPYECDVDFDDDAAIAAVGGAKDTFVYSPWWNQICTDSYVRVSPTNINHFHLLYEDPDVTNCQNADNDYGTALFDMARGAQECEPIDPVTEPRSYAHSMFAADILTIGRIDVYGSDYSPRPFTFERITIVNAPLRVCFRLAPDGPWEAAEPPGPGDHPAQYCWASLGAGTWDLSDFTAGSIAVTVTSDGDGSANYAIDDLRLRW
jgi:hypothetical protein